MSENHLLVLNRADLDSLGLTWSEIIDVLDDAFRQKAQGLVQNPPKPKVSPREGSFVHAMPAYLGGSDRVGLKWVAGFEGNSAKGLPYIHGVVIMNDPDTGRPIALIDGSWITEMRTPGVSGVTLRHVPGDPRHLAIVGCGVQGRRHLEVALHVHPGITHVSAYDPDADTVLRMFADLADDRSTRVAASAEDAVAGADLVVTTVNRPMHPTIDCAAADPDALLLPVDYDDAMAPAAFRDAAFYCVDDIGQYDSVADRIHFFDVPRPDAQLADVVAGEVTVPDRGRRMFLNMGIAMDDVALGALVLDRASAAGVGRSIQFP